MKSEYNIYSDYYTHFSFLLVKQPTHSEPYVMAHNKSERPKFWKEFRKRIVYEIHIGSAMRMKNNEGEESVMKILGAADGFTGFTRI